MTGQTTPKRLPQTPPSSTRKGFSSKPIPKFNLPDVTPKINAGVKTGQLQLRTPSTVKGKSINANLNTTLSLNEGTTLFPPSPDFTPQRSPRSKRKKMTLENIFPSQDSISSLFPKHGSIGSGRKYSGITNGSPKEFLPLDSAELFELNENLGFEEELPESLSRRGRPRKLVPGTPGKQLITEEKVRSWHGNSFHGGFSSDEEEHEVRSGPSKLANPFWDNEVKDKSDLVSKSSRKISPFASKEHVVNYDTHMELVNHRTGERKVQLLSEEQQKFKPKKIDFSGI